MTFFTLLVRQWQRRPGRTAMTAASVALAVGAVVATWVASDASRSGYERLAESIEGRPVVDVAARAGGRWSGTVLPRFTDIPGVRAAVPLVFRPTLLRSGERRVREVAVGMDVAGLVEAGLLELATGRACVDDDEVVLGQRLAASIGKRDGDTILLFAKRGVRRMTITGIAATQSLATFTDGGGVALDMAALADIGGTAGLIDRVRLVLGDGASRQAVIAAAAPRLPADLVAAAPAGRASLASELVSVANLGLDFVTGLTVAMSWLIIGNAMLMSVTERRRSFALQRLIGATSRQVARLVVADAAMIGLAGAAVGAVGGVLAARPIARGIAQAIRAPDVELAFDPRIVLVAMLTGPLIAVAAAWWPARRAAAVDLLEGLSHVAPPPERISRRLVIGAAGLWAAAIAILFAVVAEWLPPRAAVPAGIATMLAFTALTPLALPPLAHGLARLVPKCWKIEGTLALDQIIRQPVRTALTTAVLVVAVTNGVGLGHAILGSVDDVLRWYDRTLTADWMLLPAGSLAMSSDASASAGAGLVEAVRGVNGVADAIPLSLALGSVNGQACMIVARDLPPDGEIPLEAVEVGPAELRRRLESGGLAIGTALARQLRVAAGDEVTVSGFGRTIRLPVAAVVVDYMAGGTSLFLTRTAARRLFGVDSVDAMLIKVKPGAGDELRAPLQAIADRHSLLLQSNREVRGMMDRILTGLVGGLWSILGLGFVVGSLGVANTVTMNVLEKRRTIGLLRTLGMTGGQVMRMVVVESLLLGVAGCTIGIMAGIVTAVFIQSASQPLMGHPLAISIRPLVIVANLVGAVVVTALAAWLPANRAVNLDLLEAIAAD
jgi:putative ABC transport system permease protein